MTRGKAHLHLDVFECVVVASRWQVELAMNDRIQRTDHVLAEWLLDLATCKFHRQGEDADTAWMLQVYSLFVVAAV